MAGIVAWLSLAVAALSALFAGLGWRKAQHAIDESNRAPARAMQQERVRALSEEVMPKFKKVLAELSRLIHESDTGEPIRDHTRQLLALLDGATNKVIHDPTLQEHLTQLRNAVTDSGNNTGTPYAEHLYSLAQTIDQLHAAKIRPGDSQGGRENISQLARAHGAGEAAIRSLSLAIHRAFNAVTERLHYLEEHGLGDLSVKDK